MPPYKKSNFEHNNREEVKSTDSHNYLLLNQKKNLENKSRKKIVLIFIKNKMR